MQNETEIIQEWQSMLKMFKDIDHTKAQSKQEYEELKQLAQLSIFLTPRQKEAIIYRCNNVDEYYKNQNRQMKSETEKK